MTSYFELTARLRRLRGEAWAALRKQIFELVGGNIKANIAELKAQQDGKLTISDVGKLCIKYDLEMKTLCDWLEDERIVPHGMYEHLKRSGLKPRQVLETIRTDIESRKSAEDIEQAKKHGNNIEYYPDKDDVAF
jgi:hypothetical protein